MKKFEVVNYKICPDCGYQLSPEITHAYAKEWCPACGCNYEDVFPLDTKSKKSEGIIRKKEDYQSTEYDDVVRSGLL